ncbi:MAG: DUF4271 domain-containing protein [Chitinophagales bacterium]
MATSTISDDAGNTLRHDGPYTWSGWWRPRPAQQQCLSELGLCRGRAALFAASPPRRSNSGHRVPFYAGGGCGLSAAIAAAAASLRDIALYIMIGCCLLLPMVSHAQNDSATTATAVVDSNLATSDSLLVLDTTGIQQSVAMASWRSAITSADKPLRWDLEWPQPDNNQVLAFSIIVGLLLLLTYLKLAYTNDFSDIYRSLFNANISAQIYRTQTNAISFSSVLLLLMSVVSCAVFTRELWLHWAPTTFVESKFSIAVFIFLFTSFGVVRYLLLKATGALFEVEEYVDAYLFHLSASLKTLAVIMIPAILILLVAKAAVFQVIACITLIAIVALILLAYIRGLSTAYKLLYKSVYHFLLYVCVQEILPVFLFIKLLTKTAI